jgi:hypothetical protein
MALKEQSISKMIFDRMTEKTRKMADSYEQELEQARK